MGSSALLGPGFLFSLRRRAIPEREKKLKYTFNVGTERSGIFPGYRGNRPQGQCEWFASSRDKFVIFSSRDELNREKI